MSSLSEFLHMGGYAVYVWTAYGITAAVMLINVVAPMMGKRSLARRLERQARLDRRVK